MNISSSTTARQAMAERGTRYDLQPFHGQTEGEKFSPPLSVRAKVVNRILCLSLPLPCSSFPSPVSVQWRGESGGESPFWS